MPLVTRLGLVLLLCISAVSASAQHRVDRYMRHARALGTVPMKFPGPLTGATTVQLGVERVSRLGDTSYKPRTFLVDFTSSGEGTFFPPDTMRQISDMHDFVLKVAESRLLHVKLAPSHSKSEYLEIDSNLMGVLGYAFFRKFVTVFDFERGQMTLYPLYANVDISPRDTNAVITEYKDDAILTYCKCPFPSVWLDVQAPPLKPGRVHFAFATPVSEVYMSSLDARLQKRVEQETLLDSVTGKKRYPGFNLGTFEIAGKNIAAQLGRRGVRELPAMYKDLNISVMGSLGTDVLRSFSAMIFDPSRGKVIFVK